VGWLKIAVASALALVVIEVVPRSSSSGGETPPTGMMLTVAGLVALATTAAMVLVVVLDLRLPLRVAVLAGTWNVLVVVVKFVLGPAGFYEVNQHVEIENFITLEDAFGAATTAAFVLVLYVGAYWVLYRLLGRPRIADLERVRRVRGGRRVALGALAAALVVAGATGGAFVVLAPIFFLSSGLDYLSFVFSSGLSLLVGLLLAGAAALVGTAFRSAGESARAIGDASVLVSFFWVGLAFLALYHALWVVYVLVLTSIWPLKVVTPK